MTFYSISHVDIWILKMPAFLLFTKLYFGWPVLYRLNFNQISPFAYAQPPICGVCVCIGVCRGVNQSASSLPMFPA